MLRDWRAVIFSWIEVGDLIRVRRSSGMLDSMNTSKNVSVYFTPVIIIEVISLRFAIRISSGMVFGASNVGSSRP